MLDEATVEQFKVALRGELIPPGDPGYDEAGKGYNAMIGKHPRMIECCADVADVITSTKGRPSPDLFDALLCPPGASQATRVPRTVQIMALRFGRGIGRLSAF